MRLDDKQKEAVKSCLQEISNSMTRVEAERDLIKEILQRMADEFEMNKKLSRRLAKVYHKRNIAEEIAANEELTETYDMIVSSKTSAPK
jgi:ribosomal protein S17E